MTDIVERLRDRMIDYAVQEGGFTDDGTMLREAADEIERLRKEVTSITVIHTDAIIEGCAQVVDEEAEEDGYPEQLVNLAAAIRALKDKP